MIKPGEYKIVSNLIDDGLFSTKKAAYHLIDIFNTLSKTDTLQLAQSYSRITTTTSATYSLIIDDVITYPSSLTSYVIAIHRHIYKKYKLKSIDNLLEESQIEVGQSFADLCNKLGYNVTRVGLMSARWKDIDSKIDEINVGKYSGLELTWDFIGGTNRCE